MQSSVFGDHDRGAAINSRREWLREPNIELSFSNSNVSTDGEGRSDGEADGQLVVHIEGGESSVGDSQAPAQRRILEHHSLHQYPTSAALHAIPASPLQRQDLAPLTQDEHSISGVLGLESSASDFPSRASATLVQHHYPDAGTHSQTSGAFLQCESLATQNPQHHGVFQNSLGASVALQPEVETDAL